MNLLRTGLIMLIGCLASLSATPVDRGGKEKSPSQVVTELYDSAQKHFSTGTTAETIKFQKEFLTPELYARIVKKLNQPVPKGDIGEIDGDLFLDCQEAPDGVRVEKAGMIQRVSVADWPSADVPVFLKFGKEARHYTVHLVVVQGQWKVSDIDYGKDGKLTELLR